MSDKPEAPAIIKHRITADPEIAADEWEGFWRGAINGTVFNSLSFLAYHPPDRFKSHHLTLRRKGNLVGIFPAVEREEDGRRVWVSHQGASYGGPAYSPKLQYHHLEDLVRALVEYAREARFNRIQLTLPPVIYNDQPDQALPFALYRHGFQVVRTELTQAVQLDSDESGLLDTFVNKTRGAYRKAIAEGLTFRIIDQPTTAELDRFWEILVENRRGLGVVPTHSREEIERLHRLIPENLMLAVVERDGEMAAVIWNFICNRHTVLEFYMAHNAAHQRLKPVPFLTYNSLLWARQRGFRWLDFGISSIWGEPTWGLLKFKENFGSRNFLRLTWQKDL
jgi:CelD/BcsL family acetyltransferase involved in cellulose biosynthesis